MVDGEKPGVDSRDEGKHIGRVLGPKCPVTSRTWHCTKRKID